MTYLKTATAELHSKAEKMEFNQRMFRGELSPVEYVLYLAQQLEIFSIIEIWSIGYSDLPNQNLRRTQAIISDLNELHNNFDVDFPQVLVSTKRYVDYIKSIEENQLNAHIYLNYLALVFGGQMMKSKVPGSGKMYEFENMKDCIESIRAIQNDEMADEVNIGFTYIINILDELQTGA